MRQPPLYDDVHAWLKQSARRLGSCGGAFGLLEEATVRINEQERDDETGSS